MSFTKLAFATFSTAVLVAGVPIITGNSILADVTQAQQTQETTISISSNDLRKPHVLSVSASTSQLTGRVKLDGEWLQNLNNGIQINLSPYLTRGTHTITIVGNYAPANASVEINFTGPNTHVNQQISGSGSIDQTLTIEVNE